MIDFHCHLDLYRDPYVVRDEIVDLDCDVLAVTTTPLAWEGTRDLIGHAPRILLAAGLHPELVEQRHHEVEHLCDLISETRFVGEVGLDGSRLHLPSLPIQQRVFDRVLSTCASLGGRIISIHSRGATSVVLERIEACARTGVPVLHWFSGTISELQRAIRLGCWFSVGPAMLRSGRGRFLASRMPVDRILTETDGDLPPEPVPELMLVLASRPGI